MGERFLECVERAFERIADDPTSFELVGGEIRRCRVLGFPYDVLLAGEPERVVIVAIMHHHRRPGYWKGRL